MRSKPSTCRNFFSRDKQSIRFYREILINGARRKRIARFAIQKIASPFFTRRWEIQRPPRRRRRGEDRVIDNSREDTICLFFSSTNRRQPGEISFWVRIPRGFCSFQGERHKREETPPADCQTLRIKGSSLSLSLLLPACLDETPAASYGSLKKIDLNHGQDNKSALLRGNAGEKNEGRSDTRLRTAVYARYKEGADEGAMCIVV